MTKATKPFIAVVICWMFYLFAFFARVEPGVLVNDLMKDFSLNATQVGTIVSTLYIPYVVMQLPWGLISDKLGSRLVIFLCSTVCGIGVLTFGLATAPWQLSCGRFLIGLSAAGAFLSCGKVVSEVMPQNKYAFYMGVTTFIGSLGGVLGSGITAKLAESFGWRPLTCLIAIIGLIVGISAFLCIKKGTSSSEQKEDTLQGLKLLSVNPSAWLIGFYGCASFLPLSAVAELWGTPFIQARFGVSTSDASICSSVIFVCFGLGSILAAKIAEKLNSNKNACIMMAIGLLVSFSVAIYSNALSFWSCVILFGIGSTFAGSSTLTFDMAYKCVPSEYAGTSAGFNNMLIMLSGIVFQPLMGRLLDFFRDGKTNPDGTPLYELCAYRDAFIVIIVVVTLATIGMAFVKNSSGQK